MQLPLRETPVTLTRFCHARSLALMSCPRSRIPFEPFRPHLPPKLAVVTILLLSSLLLLLSACGTAPTLVQDTQRLDAEGLTGPARYTQALRWTALARVEARAGADQMASQHLRAATRLGGEPAWLLEQAEAEERAKLFAEARDTAQRALLRDLLPTEKLRAEAVISRVTPQIQQGLVRVAILVRPEGARVELNRADAKRRRNYAGGAGAERVLIGTGYAWLVPGTWTLETTQKGFNSELRTIQVGADANLVAIALTAEDQGPALVNQNPGGNPPTPVVVPEPEPEPVPVVVAPVVVPAPVVPVVPPVVPVAPVPVAVVKPLPVPPPVEIPKPVEVTKPAEITKPVEVAKVIPPKPIEPPKPVAPPKPIEPPKVVEKKPEPPQETKLEPQKPKEPEPEPLPPRVEIAKPHVDLQEEAEPGGRPSWIHRVGPYAVAGLGVAALVTGGVFGALALNDASSANGLNPKDKTYDSQVDTLANSANSHAALSNALLISGGVLVAAGTVWWFLAPQAEIPRVPRAQILENQKNFENMALIPRVGISPSSVALRWTF